MGDHDQAEATCRESIELARAAVGDEHLETGGSFYLLGRILLTVRRFPEAKEAFKECDRINLVVLGSAHWWHASCQAWIGEALTGMGRFEEAEPLILTNHTLIVQTDCPAGGVLVYAETFAPGWRVWVDGQPAEVMRANAVSQAVVVPAGRHQVHFKYVPRGLVVGAATSALAILILAGGLAATRSRRRA